MAERAGIFDSTDFDISDFAPQKPTEKPSTEKVRQVAEQASFTSREPELKPKHRRREARVYRTNRNVQLSVKADPRVIDDFYDIADAQGWVLGETLERAVDALRKQVEREKKKGSNAS
jgi:hypothetical protein